MKKVLKFIKTIFTIVKDWIVSMLIFSATMLGVSTIKSFTKNKNINE
jgi:hypothetical protein